MDKVDYTECIEWMSGGHMGNDVSVNPGSSPDRIKLSKLCKATGEIFQLTINNESLKSWRNGEFIQDVFPELTAGEREFIKTGITPEEFEAMFPEDEE